MQKFDWRWLVLGIIAIVTVAIAIVVNSKTTDNSVNSFLGSIAIDNSDLKVNWERYQTINKDLTESFNITESGTYHLTGALDNGQISIDAGVSEVRLILDNVSITNLTGPAIIAHNAENLVIELVGENILSDGLDYSPSYNEDVNGVIYSKADLAFTGYGTLRIHAIHGDGIVGKDDITIRNGAYQISTPDDGIRGKDSVYITNGSIAINSEGDAIKSTNTTDFGKGFILVEGGNLNLTATGKGLSAEKTIAVQNGNLVINTTDDAIHSGNYVGITNGVLTIDSGDDGIHAGNELIIDGGTIDITKSYEGAEAQTITINAGTLNIFATDDGINAGENTDGSTAQPKFGPPTGDENCILTINGGSIYVNSAGDGIDSNGYLIFNGGKTIIDGPTNNGNGALDAGIEITIQGGTVIAVGAAGMAESLGANSNICNLSVFFDSVQPAGTVVEIRDSNNEVVLSHTAAKSFSHLAAGTESLTLGGSYTIYLNGESYQHFIILEVTTIVGGTRISPDNANSPMSPDGVPPES